MHCRSSSHSMHIFQLVTKKHIILILFKYFSVWKEVLFERLKVRLSNSLVLMTECPLNPAAARERTALTFFEEFEASKFQLSCSAQLALFATFRATGIVVESGDGLTSVVCLPNSLNYTYDYFLVTELLSLRSIMRSNSSSSKSLLLDNFHTLSKFHILGI